MESSQAPFGARLQPPKVALMKPDHQSVLPSYAEQDGGSVTESPCAVAASKRVNNDVDYVAGNTSEHSSSAAVANDEPSSPDADTKLPIKIESHPYEEGTGATGKIGTSPSKPGLSKL